MAEHESKVKFRNEINENTKLPLRIVYVIVGTAFIMCAAWFDLRYEMNRHFDKLEAEMSETVSQKQVRNWIDDMRDANAGKGVSIPRLPDKSQKTESFEPLAIVQNNQVIVK